MHRWCVVAPSQKGSQDYNLGYSDDGGSVPTTVFVSVVPSNMARAATGHK